MPAVFSQKDIEKLQVTKFHLFNFKNLSGWLEVDSAFGGMGLYKSSAFQQSRYFGMEDGQEICEHLSFHHHAKLLGATFFINPSFVVGEASTKFNEHAHENRRTDKS